jgi:ribosome-binding protein aMBF1 (putative translation factor)
MQNESVPPAVLEVQERLEVSFDRLAVAVAEIMTAPVHREVYNVSAPDRDWRLPGDPTGQRKQTPRDFPIGAAIRAAREHVKMSQNDLQAKTGMTHQYVSKIENGHSEPSFTTVKRFADALGVPLWKMARYAERVADGE